MTALPGAADYGATRRARKASLARAARIKWAREHPEDDRHGTPNFYKNYGCRCDPCRRARAQEQSGEWRPHEPGPYTVAEHRAFGERLCHRCRIFVQNFSG